MDAIIAQIHTLAKAADDEGRLAIIKALRQVQVELQNPQESLMHVANLGMTGAILRIGADLGLFKLLAQNEHALQVEAIAKLTSSSSELLERLLRYLAAANIIKETGTNEYTASAVTHVMADPKGEAMIYHGFDTHGPVVQAMPDFFAENKYQNITETTNTPFQKAFNTQLSAFDWMVQNPKHFENLQTIMSSLQGSEWTVGLDFFSKEAKKVPSSASQATEKPFLVDVGGGHGHQCRELGKKFPNLLGYLVLQDLPEAVEKLAPIEGVTVQACDFFQPQPITGANYYYLRRIMHDWSDEKAAIILRNITVAMGPDSRILIDDAVLPDIGASWLSTFADLAMMGFAGKERTRAQWNALARRAGLVVESVHNYVASTDTAIVVMALE